jgi:glutathione S-transferase
MMTLYWSSRSPYVRKVMVAAYEVDVRDQLTLVRKDIAILKPDGEVIAANPLGKIPVLVLDDGTTFFDSSVICEFLDGLTETPRLFPIARPDRLKAMRWQALGNGLMDLMVIGRAERKRPDGSRSDPHIAAYQRKMMTVLDGLENEAEEISRAAFTIGSLTIGCALSYADFRSAEIGLTEVSWRNSRPKLAQWHDGFRKRASVQATEHSDVY